MTGVQTCALPISRPRIIFIPLFLQISITFPLNSPPLSQAKMEIYPLSFSHLISSSAASSAVLALSPRIHTNLEKWHFNCQIHVYSPSRSCYNSINEVWIKRFGIYENRRNRENRRKSLKTHEMQEMQEMQEYRGKSHDLRDTYTKIH